MRYKTLAEAAQAAMDVQNACNLSGVAFSFADAMRAVCAFEPNLSTDERNRHPIAVLFISKMESLSNATSMTAFSNAWERCEEMVKTEPSGGVL